MGTAKGEGHLAALVWRLRRMCAYVIRLSALPPIGLRGLDCGCFFLPRLGLSSQGPEVRAHHASHCRRNTFHNAPEFARLAIPPDARQTRPAMVVSRDADLFLFVLNRCRHVPGYLDSDVDGKGVGTPDRNRATGSDGPDLVLVAIALFGLSARRYVRSGPVLGCIFRETGFPVRSRDRARRYRSSGPPCPCTAASAAPRALSRCAFGYPWRDSQPRERISPGHGLKRADAPDRTSFLFPFRFRVGHLCWPHRGDHLPFRPRRTSHAFAAQGRDRIGLGTWIGYLKRLGSKGARTCARSPTFTRKLRWRPRVSQSPACTLPPGTATQVIIARASRCYGVPGYQSTLSLRPLSSHRLSRVWLQNPSQKNWRRRLEFWTLNCGPTWTHLVG